MTTAVIGGGSWGTALASVLAYKGPVRLWARSAAVAEGINTLHRNPRYQSDLDLPKNIVATTSMAEALADVELVCVVVPSRPSSARQRALRTARCRRWKTCCST
jgi:glycerol-3-phosphate dehydrogenase (NAD(P)+)